MDSLVELDIKKEAVGKKLSDQLGESGSKKKENEKQNNFKGKDILSATDSDKLSKVSSEMSASISKERIKIEKNVIAADAKENKYVLPTDDLGKRKKELETGSKAESTKISLLPELVPVVIPVDILSPPKSESQTDETNTATTSPASEATLSPKLDVAEDILTQQISSALKAPMATALLVAPSTITSGIKSVNTASAAQSIKPSFANGAKPKSGKPLLATINKKLNKPTRPTKKRKPKALVALYESEISHNKMGIKLCIKKSDLGPAKTTLLSASAKTAGNAQKNRKRSRKSKTKVDSDDSEFETKRKKERNKNSNSEQAGKQKKIPATSSSGDNALDDTKPCVDQSVWGANLPEELLYQIFKHVVDMEGCMPTLYRLGRVCTLWRRVSLRPTLWKSMDLSSWIKEKYRTELKLKWFVDNRCSACTDLNIANWKITNIDCFLHKLVVGCPNLESISLSGWKGFTCEHLTFLVDNMKKLERLDLSSINSEMNPSKSAVGLQSLRNALGVMKGRLTHLYLAHNRLPGIPQIIESLASNCPNLLLLDLSNVFTQAASHAVLHVEKLQRGCPKLKVLRITNSRMSLNNASIQEMMDSNGFADLEELSVAAQIGDESRLIGDEHLQRILKTSSKLKLLDVRGCMRLSHESLIRLPAWDIKHLFLSGCSVTRDFGSRLELIASKWAHSLIELDLAWTNVQQPLDNALRVIAEKGLESPLAHLNLCGSSVSEDAVKDILANCAYMSSINLSSCRGLPRGVKRLIQGPEELRELRDVLKVQMKVKLPLRLKVPAKTEASLETATTAVKTNQNVGGVSTVTATATANATSSPSTSKTTKTPTTTTVNLKSQSDTV